MREEIALAAIVLAEPWRDRFELRDAEQNTPGLRSFMRSDDFEIFELLHDTDRARMSDREARLQLCSRREARFDDELRGFVRQRIDVAFLVFIADRHDLEIDAIFGIAPVPPSARRDD